MSHYRLILLVHNYPRCFNYYLLQSIPEGLHKGGFRMFFLLVGVALLVLKWQAIGPVADWSWWVVLSPFALAALWWWYADFSGYTKRKAMEKDEARKAERQQQARERLKNFRRPQ